MAVLRKKVRRLEAQQRELTQKIDKLYEDVVDGLLSRDAYMAQKARLVEQRDNALETEAEIQAEILEWPHEEMEPEREHAQSVENLAQG